MRAFFSTLTLLLLALPMQAEACSFSWKKGWSPEEIKHRNDVRKVKGKFKLQEILGKRRTDEDGKEWIIDAKMIGRLDTKRGTGWNTIHNAPDHSITCYIGTYFKPEGDARGVFWISRKSENGRYRILLWEGEYLPVAQAEAAE